MAAAAFDDIVMSDPAFPYVHWRIGDVTVTKVVETEMRRSVAASLPNVDEDALAKLSWLGDDFAVVDGTVGFSFHSFVIETASRVIVVDTCFGNDKTRPGMAYCDALRLPYLETLIQAGCQRDSVDAVICTHFHNDHVGWNTTLVDSAWLPTFPYARYLFTRQEFAHWTNALAAGGVEGIGEAMAAAFADSILPLTDAGVVDLVGPNHRICEEVRLVPTPGHTPGHVGVLIESRGEYGFITGDAIHHPLQLADPTWSTGFDADDAQAIKARTSILDTAVETRALIFGTHWVGGSAYRVARDANGYRLGE